MLENWNKCIYGSKVILVPYKKDHVAKYHEWMKNPELQELTGSESLTLEQEYEMQETWRDSEDKCTFIVLSREIYEGNENEIGAMVGDTNLFLTCGDDGEKVAEAEIMIAEESARGKRLGWEAACLMLAYGASDLGVDVYEVKIKCRNEKSLGMFGKLGFVEVCRSEVFQEVTLRTPAPIAARWTKDVLEKETRKMEVRRYENH
jgi:RimJ/RimL family protein N-acetyltransferase